MSNKEDDYAGNSRQNFRDYLNRRRNATPHFTYNHKRDDDQRASTSGTIRSHFDHSRIGRGFAMKHGTSRFGNNPRNQTHLTRTVINTFKDDNALTKNAISGAEAETRSGGGRPQTGRYKYTSPGFGTRKPSKIPVPRLAIGDANEIKPLTPIQPFCKLSNIDQGVFDYTDKFTQDYFYCYDNNRDSLLAHYHSNAFYSISLNLKSEACVKAAKFDDSYFDTGSRNLNFVRDDKEKYKMLHRGQFDIVASIKKNAPH